MLLIFIVYIVTYIMIWFFQPIKDWLKYTMTQIQITNFKLVNVTNVQLVKYLVNLNRFFKKIF